MEFEVSLPLQHQHLFFEDELEGEAPKPPSKYTPLEKQEILDHLIALQSPIDEHHPCEVLTFFRMDGVLPLFLARPEFAHFSEYLRVWNESKRLIYNDDKDGFASFLRSNWGIIEKLPPIVLLKSICACSAVGCATVLFESGVNLNIDIEAQIWDPTEKKLLCKYSLSEAVTEPSIPVEIIKLLFKHGGLPDTLPWSPLFKVLGMISYEHCSNWTPEKSIYKLFHLLCLPELEETFEIIKLLASCTKLVERSVIKLVEEGKFAEVTALLIGARDQLLVPSGEDGGLTNTLVEVELRKEFEELKRLTNVEDQRTSNFVFALNLVNSLRKCIDVLHDYRVSPRAKNVSNDEVPSDVAANIVCNTELTMERKDVYCIDIERAG